MIHGCTWKKNTLESHSTSVPVSDKSTTYLFCVTLTCQMIDANHRCLERHHSAICLEWQRVRLHVIMISSCMTSAIIRATSNIELALSIRSTFSELESRRAGVVNSPSKCGNASYGSCLKVSNEFASTTERLQVDCSKYLRAWVKRSG